MRFNTLTDIKIYIVCIISEGVPFRSIICGGKWGFSQIMTICLYRREDGYLKIVRWKTNFLTFLHIIANLISASDNVATDVLLKTITSAGWQMQNPNSGLIGWWCITFGNCKCFKRKKQITRFKKVFKVSCIQSYFTCYFCLVCSEGGKLKVDKHNCICRFVF